ncbi:hypothetical protein ABID23_001429 [Bartonella silvatica]|uniref:Uncharacterized protein n=1 Tax=Bartonella silvatica TaxID=357760 RepID=A0ABV2HID9_9HYPH
MRVFWHLRIGGGEGGDVSDRKGTIGISSMPENGWNSVCRFGMLGIGEKAIVESLLRLWGGKGVLRCFFVIEGN